MKGPKFANMLRMTELETPENGLNPFGILSQLRRERPVRFDENRSCWDVFLYEDVHRILKDPKTFSSARGAFANQNLLFIDPPKHHQLRDLVNKAFTPRAIQELAPRIRDIAKDLLSQATGADMDVVHDFATPLPVIVIAELLGVPSSDRQHFKQWSDVLVESAEDLSDEAFAQISQKRMKTVKELTDYFQGILKERASEPKDDLISALMQAEIEGEKLSEQEIVNFCILLLAAGNETTTNLITNSFRVLTEQPQLQAELAQDPGVIPTFIEEVLRYYPPIVSIGRVATEDVQIGGSLIHKGDQVITWVGAANRDETKFTDPDAFHKLRKPNPHMSFGFGIHFCLGAPLARLEGHIAIETLLQICHDIKLVPGREIVPIQSSFVFGLKNYPVTFESLAK
ncbi:cytochrome P450 [Paenibacillus sp. GP183]|uniref:cytochrome P450 n=1 Tax=Paenibacillus sp. GP183 TaxID=1882751 RepID=UPI00089AE0BC|nr:cytochrome P450 [Paenibacillus sp. GP183]SEB86830.1 Cytochrome P450 [Paenibacillus sp. GP183]